MIQLIQIILATISPTLRDLIIQFIRSLKTSAEQTPNPLDNIFVEILFVIFDIKD